MSQRTPNIQRLSPEAVHTNWEGTLALYGENFADGDLVLISARVAATTFKSSILIEAQVTSEMTKDAGTKDVLVHTPAGAVSNTLPFVVK
jgi:hypothetical protein